MTEPSSLLDDLLDRLEGLGLDADDRLLVAYSGGLDSSVLVDLLDRARHRGGPALNLVHIDHGLRPDSGDDAAWCRRHARRRGLPITVRTLSEDSTSPSQARARMRRMATIAEVALADGIEYVATGHHGDDRIETFLFHLRRGTGLDGLATVRARDSFPIPGAALTVIRPLSRCTRDRLGRYATARSISHIDDPTNATDAYSRNRIRHHLVPKLAQSPGEKQRIVDTIHRLDAERRAADEYARRLADDATRDCPGLRTRTFSRSRLSEAPDATVARLFQHLQPTLNADSIARIQRAIDGPVGSRVHHLTLSGCVITVAADRVVFAPSDERGGRDVLKRRVHPVHIRPFSGAASPFFGATLRWRLVDDEFEAGAGERSRRWIADFCPDKLKRPLQVGGFRPGARLLRFDGDNHYHQKLTKLFSTHSVDADRRWRWPCLYDAQKRLLWAAGLERGAAARLDDDDRRWWRFSVVPSRELTESLQS